MNKSDVIWVEHYDGTIETKQGHVKGLRKDGNRPAVIYYEPNVDKFVKYNMLHAAVNPVSGRVVPVLTSLGQYVHMKDGKLWEVHRHKFDEDKLYLVNGEDFRMYDKYLDGNILDKDSALDKYPELFV